MGFVNPHEAVEAGNTTFRAANGWIWTYTGFRNHEVMLRTDSDGGHVIFFTSEGRANIPDRHNDGRYELVVAAPTEALLPPDPVAAAEAGRTVMTMADGTTRYYDRARTAHPAHPGRLANPVHDVVWLVPPRIGHPDHGLYFYRNGRDNIGAGNRVASTRRDPRSRPTADTADEVSGREPTVCPDTVCPHDEIAAGRTWFRAADGAVWRHHAVGGYAHPDVRLRRVRAADGRAYAHTVWFTRDGVINLGYKQDDPKYRLIAAYDHDPDARASVTGPDEAREAARRGMDQAIRGALADTAGRCIADIVGRTGTVTGRLSGKAPSHQTVPRVYGVNVRLTPSEAETLRAIVYTSTTGSPTQSRRRDADSVDRKLRAFVSDERASEVGRQIDGCVRFEPDTSVRDAAHPAEPVTANLVPGDTVGVACPRPDVRRRDVRVVANRTELLDNGGLRTVAVWLERSTGSGEAEGTEFRRQPDGRYTRGEAVLVR